MQNKPITLTSSAALHIQNEIEKSIEKSHDKIIGIRLGVKKTGCSGYAYIVDFIKSSDQVSKEDLVFNSHDICIYVDNLSYQFVAGTEIDYIKKNMNSTMVFNNPNVTAECGCGESFTVDKK